MPIVARVAAVAKCGDQNSNDKTNIVFNGFGDQGRELSVIRVVVVVFCDQR